MWARHRLAALGGLGLALASGQVGDYGQAPTVYSPPGVVVKAVPATGGYAMEVAIAWSALELTGAPASSELAFDLAVSDGTGSQQVEQLGYYLGTASCSTSCACPPPAHSCCCGTAPSPSSPELFCEDDDWALMTLDP